MSTTTIKGDNFVYNIEYYDDEIIVNGCEYELPRSNKKYTGAIIEVKGSTLYVNGFKLKNGKFIKPWYKFLF